MENEPKLLEPDLEIRMLVAGVERCLIGMFVGDDDQVDIGMGVDPDTDIEALAAALETAAEALLHNSNWYDKDGLDLAPSVANEIKNGRRS